jgi:hypothetical protein
MAPFQSLQLACLHGYHSMWLLSSKRGIKIVPVKNMASACDMGDISSFAALLGPCGF